MKKLLCALLFPLFLLSCSTLGGLFKKPEVSIRSVDIESLSLRDITFLFNIELNNPYPVGFRLDDIGFNVKIDGSPLFKTRAKKGVQVPAGGREITPVSVKLEYESIMRVIKNYAERDTLSASIDVDIVIPLPAALHAIKKNITFNYTVERKIPAIKPSVKILNVTVTRPALSDIKKSLSEAGEKSLDPRNILDAFGDIISGKKGGAKIIPDSLDVPVTISFDVEVKNGTRAVIRCRDLAYDFFINNEKIISGVTSEVRNENDRFVIGISTTFSSRSLATSVMKMFTTREAQYRLTGHSNIKLPDEIRTGAITLQFDESGKFTLK